MLFTRLQRGPDGEPIVPGNLDVWKQILAQKSDSKVARDWGKRARAWKKPEQLLEGMAGLSRIDTDQGPLQIYLTLSEMDSRRAPDRRLTPETVLLLANKFSQLSGWYLVFSEFPGLNDESIAQFVKVADTIDAVSNHSLRGNAMGVFQANLGLWQILARQKEISPRSTEPILAAGDCALCRGRFPCPAIRRRSHLAENADAGGGR